MFRTEEAQASSTRPSVEGIASRTLAPVADSEGEVEDVTSDEEGDGTSKGTESCWKSVLMKIDLQ